MLKLLILRLTPRGLLLPRLLPQRPRAISASIASRYAVKRSGGIAAACGILRLITRTACVKLKVTHWAYKPRV